MVRRKVIDIDEAKCTGCGACVTKCAEGALMIVNGKARVVNDVFCDGLGACIGDCPESALKIVEREAPEFDEESVKGHLAKENGAAEEPCGCPSHEPIILTASRSSRRTGGPKSENPAQLANWPVQWRLVTARMPFFKGKEVLLAADCVPFAYGDFHTRFLSGKALIIGCPKLDEQKAYLDRLTEVLRDATPKSIDIVHMEVPCCFGLERLVKEAIKRSAKEIPVRTTVVGVKGDILSEK